MANFESRSTATVAEASRLQAPSRRTRRRGQAFVLVADEEIGRRDGIPMGPVYVWNILWGGKYTILLATLICAGLSIAYALNATQWYRAEVVLVAPTGSSGHGLANQLGGLGAAGGLIGSLGIGLDNSNVEALAVLESAGFTRDFIREENLLPVLYAKDWDAATGKWRSADPKYQPDLDDAVDFFEKSIRKVQDDKKTGVVRLVIEWTDPKVAAAWANLFVERLNERMRERALGDSEANISYLRKVMAGESTIILQQSIGHVLESELQKEMLARGNKEFSFTVVDRAAPPKWRTRPKRAQIVAIATILGALFGVGIVMVRRVIIKDLARARQSGQLEA